MAEPGGAMRIGVIGCAGRMGRTNLQEVLATPASSACSWGSSRSDEASATTSRR